MKKLKSIIESTFLVQDIDLSNNQWHLEIPSNAGWYYIATDTPLETFLHLTPPPSEYRNNEGKLKKCRNYNIPSRTEALIGSLGSDAIVIDKEGMHPIYSGMAKNLLNRAREHTFGHKGTAGLALSNYQELKLYKWKFYYKENTLKYSTNGHRNIILKLGEQIWRTNNGWPILCSS